MVSVCMYGVHSAGSSRTWIKKETTACHGHVTLALQFTPLTPLHFIPSSQNSFFLLSGFFLFFKYLFIYLFMAVLGLRFCARAFSSCGKRGPLFIAVRGPLTIAASPDTQAQ